jgi:hypothetical protein
VCLASAFALVISAAAFAQQASPTPPPAGDEDPVAHARVHFGPLGLTPSAALSNMGIDTNVFNAFDDPKQDFTMTFTPQSDLWMHMGRGLLSGHVSAGLVYFQKFASERAFNTADALRFDLPLNRFRPYVIEAYTNARQRPNFEIDARSRYQVDATTIGVDLALFGKTTVGVYGRRDRTRYQQDELFFGTNLANALNRTDNTLGFRIAHELTPLTTVTLSGETERDRFQVDTRKDSNSQRYSLGVDLNPAALISGSATVGYRRFHALGPGVPDYNGLTAKADVSYILLGVTQLSMQFLRDLDYSFYGVDQAPYYVLTGLSGSVTQHFFGPFDLVARAGHQHLAYRGTLSSTTSAANRVDTYRTVGGGLSYRYSPDVRLGFNIDDVHRTTPLEDHAFDGLRFGVSVTYGPQQ